MYRVGQMQAARPTAALFADSLEIQEELAPQVGLEPTTLRLTAGCSAIELLRSKAVSQIECARYYTALKPVNQLSPSLAFTSPSVCAPHSVFVSMTFAPVADHIE